MIVVTGAGNAYAVDADPGTAGDQQMPTGLSHLAALEYTIAVGAVLDSSVNGAGGQWQQLANQQAYLSQRHQRLLDVLAPGVEIPASSATGTGIIVTGTEYASAYVSGSAVLAQQYAQSVLGRRLRTSEYRQMVQQTSKSLADQEVSEGTNTTFNVVNIGAAFPVLDLHLSTREIPKRLEGTPRAIPTAPILQVSATTGGSRTATLSWERGPESKLFDAWIVSVTTSGTQQTVWQSSVVTQAPGGTALSGTSVTATWTVTANETSQYIWWVRAWDGVPNGTQTNHGDWSIQRRLYLVGDVATPLVPAYVGSVTQPLDAIDLNFTAVPGAAIYALAVDRLAAFDLFAGASRAAAVPITGVLPGQLVTGPGIPAGTLVRTVTTAFPNPQTAPQWNSNGGYPPNVDFLVTIPASGQFNDVLGQPLRNGQSYVMFYPVPGLTGSSLTPLEVAKMARRSSISGDTIIELTNASLSTSAGAVLTFPDVLSVSDSPYPRLRPKSELVPGSYQVRARATNSQN